MTVCLGLRAAAAAAAAFLLASAGWPIAVTIILQWQGSLESSSSPSSASSSPTSCCSPWSLVLNLYWCPLTSCNHRLFSLFLKKFLFLFFHPFSRKRCTVFHGFSTNVSSALRACDVASSTNNDKLTQAMKHATMQCFSRRLHSSLCSLPSAFQSHHDHWWIVWTLHLEYANCVSNVNVTHCGTTQVGAGIPSGACRLGKVTASPERLRFQQLMLRLHDFKSRFASFSAPARFFLLLHAYMQGDIFNCLFRSVSSVWFFFLKEMTVTHATLLYDESHFHSSARLLSSTLEMKAEPSSSLAAKPFFFFFTFPSDFACLCFHAKTKKGLIHVLFSCLENFLWSSAKKGNFGLPPFFLYSKDKSISKDHKSLPRISLTEWSHKSLLCTYHAN